MSAQDGEPEQGCRVGEDPDGVGGALDLSVSRNVYVSSRQVEAWDGRATRHRARKFRPRVRST